MQIQGLTPPQLLLVRRVGAALLGPRPIPNRGIEYDRVLATNGDTWELQGLADRVTLEQLFALHRAGTVWVTDPDRGNFHATIEVEAAWVAEDAPELEGTAQSPLADSHVDQV
ncbi:MAG: hypothetical protein ABSC50_03115 [Candidatus Bathyarchaeia archaeon]